MYSADMIDEEMASWEIAKERLRLGRARLERTRSLMADAWDDGWDTGHNAGLGFDGGEENPFRDSGDSPTGEI